MTTPPLPEEIELHRDRTWRRDEDLRIESAASAERFIEDVGFANPWALPTANKFHALGVMTAIQCHACGVNDVRPRRGRI